jgi:hypothetical protein
MSKPAHTTDALVDRFMRNEIEPDQFPHESHVEVAYGLLRRSRFPGALMALSSGLADIARRAGKADRYHETITVGFLSIIAERLMRGSTSTYAEFIRANPDLFDKNLLLRFYTSERLGSKQARQTFILPTEKGVS